jgi:hypothetical protein
MRYAGIVLIVGLALAGCSDPGNEGPLDATPDSDAGADAGDERDGGDGAGLAFRFISEPSLPGELDGELDAVIERAELVLVQVRAIGDSSPGGEGTSAGSFALSWADDEAEELRFPQAPPGIYAQLMAELASYEIEGTVQISGEDVPFRVADTSAAIQVSVILDELELEPGENREVTIHVNLGDVIQGVDWDEVPPDEENVRYVGEASSQTPDVRARLAACIGRDDNSGPSDDDERSGD